MASKPSIITYKYMLSNIDMKKIGLVKPIYGFFKVEDGLQPHVPDLEMTSGSSDFVYPVLI